MYQKFVDALERRFFALRARGAASVDGDVIVLGVEAFGQRNARPVIEFNVEHGIAAIAIKVAVFFHIGAEPGCSTLEGHLFDQTTLNQRG